MRIKYEATKAIVRRFLNGTVTLIHLLSKAEPALDWDGYCALPIAGQFKWETRADALTQEMIVIMNSKNGLPRRTYDLPIPKRTTPHIRPISKRQLGTYQHNIPITSLVTNEKTNKEKRMIQTLKIRITPRVVSLGHTLRILQQTKTPPLLAEEDILGVHPIVDTFWDNTNPADVSVDTVNNEKQMAGSHTTKLNTPEEKEIVLKDLLSQENQNFDNRHD